MHPGHSEMSKILPLLQFLACFSAAHKTLRKPSFDEGFPSNNVDSWSPWLIDGIGYIATEGSFSPVEWDAPSSPGCDSAGNQDHLPVSGKTVSTVAHKITNAFGLKYNETDIPSRPSVKFFNEINNDLDLELLDAEMHVVLFFDCLEKAPIGSLEWEFETYWEYIRDRDDFCLLDGRVAIGFIERALELIRATPIPLEDLIRVASDTISIQNLETFRNIIVFKMQEIEFRGASDVLHLKYYFDYFLNVIVTLLKHYGLSIFQSQIFRQNNAKEGIFWFILQLSPLLGPMFIENYNVVTSENCNEFYIHALYTKDGGLLPLISWNSYAAMELLFRAVFIKHQHTDFSTNGALVAVMRTIVNVLIQESMLPKVILSCAKLKFLNFLDAIFYVCSFDHNSKEEGRAPFDLMPVLTNAAHYHGPDALFDIAVAYLSYFPFPYKSLSKCEAELLRNMLYPHIYIQATTIVKNEHKKKQRRAAERLTFLNKYMSDLEMAQAQTTANGKSSSASDTDRQLQKTESAGEALPSELLKHGAADAPNVKAQESEHFDPQEIEKQIKIMAVTIVDSIVNCLKVLIAGAEMIPFAETRLAVFDPTNELLLLMKDINLNSWTMTYLYDLGRIFLARQTGNPVSCFKYQRLRTEDYSWLDMIQFINIHLSLFGSSHFEIIQSETPFDSSSDIVSSNRVRAHYRVGPVAIDEQEDFFNDITDDVQPDQAVIDEQFKSNP